MYLSVAGEVASLCVIAGPMDAGKNEIMPLQVDEKATGGNNVDKKATNGNSMDEKPADKDSANGKGADEDVMNGNAMKHDVTGGHDGLLRRNDAVITKRIRFRKDETAWNGRHEMPAKPR